MILWHLFLFIIGIALLWVSSRIVISGIDQFAKSLKTSAFSISFLVLGILTSITEMSVGVNAVLEKNPGIFVGNLIGGSFVILAFIIPLLAVANKGVKMGNHLRPKRLVYFLLLAFAPLVTLINGRVSMYEAFFLILFYALFMYSVEKQEQESEQRKKHQPADSNSTSVVSSLILVVIGIIVIFGASKLLITEVVYFADMLHVAPLLISILVLSLGTNLPEISIAVSAIKMRETDIAIGDYIGSVAANTLLFGIFSAMNGSFSQSFPYFWLTFIIILIGYVLFFLFLRSSRTLSAKEGIVLGIIFLFFIILQTSEIVAVSSKNNGGETLTREEVVLLLRDRYAELSVYGTDTLPPASIKTEEAQEGWYAAFILSGSGVPSILNARCYFVSHTKEIREIGEFTRPEERFVNDIDVKTCLPTDSESAVFE